MNKSRKAILTAKRTLAGNSLGADKKVNLKTFFRQLDFMDGETTLRIDSLKSLFKLNKQEMEIKRRGIEILGELISSVTGVPSAQDHRAVLESMRLLRLDASEIKSFLKTNANSNQALLKSPVSYTHLTLPTIYSV